MLPHDLNNRAEILAAFANDFGVAAQAVHLALSLLYRLNQTNRRWAKAVTKAMAPKGENTITTVLSSEAGDLQQLPTQLRYATTFLGIVLQDLNKVFRLGNNKDIRQLFLALQKP